METLPFLLQPPEKFSPNSFPFKYQSVRNKLRFVIKEHHATRAHYDFRLEVTAALKSWVIEKEGPSMRAGEQRVVRMVGDHNPDFIFREGIIPKGQYGAGEMIVWDKGLYFPIGGGKSKREDRLILEAMLKIGEIRIFLMGHKLKGEFKLKKAYFDAVSWLLEKEDDHYCTDDAMTKLNRSVLTGKTIFEWRDFKKRQNRANYSIFED
ncbi:MAG: 3'-phosphoesterase [Ignavibacteria bacterium]|nr:3'-phosphoesterase [Ignavibacteria bacterium]